MKPELLKKGMRIEYRGVLQIWTGTFLGRVRNERTLRTEYKFEVPDFAGIDGPRDRGLFVLERAQVIDRVEPID